MKKIIAIITACIFVLVGCEAAPTDILVGQGASQDTEEVADSEDVTDTEADVDTEPDTEPDSELDTEADTEADSEPGEVTSEITAETTAETTTETTAETTAETTTETTAETTPDTETAWRELGRIGLKNVTYTFLNDAEMVALNPGTVGAMLIMGEVYGPVGVSDVFIASWGEDIISWSQKTIYEEAQFYAQMWKAEGAYDALDNEIPFEVWTSHPVFAEDLGKDVYVLLIGVDSEGEPVAYAIMSGTIPRG